MANSDGRDQDDISMKDLWARYFSWVEGKYTSEQIEKLFAGSAEAFYGI